MSCSSFAVTPAVPPRFHGHLHVLPPLIAVLAILCALARPAHAEDFKVTAGGDITVTFST